MGGTAGVSKSFEQRIMVCAWRHECGSPL